MWNYGCFMASLSAANTEKMEVLLLLSGGGGRCRQTWLPQFKMLPAVQSVRHVMMQRSVLAGQVAGGPKLRTCQACTTTPTIPPFEASKPRRTHSWQRLLTAAEKKKRGRLFHGRNSPKHCFSACVLFHSMHGQRSSPRHGHGPHPSFILGMREHESISRFPSPPPSELC